MSLARFEQLFPFIVGVFGVVTGTGIGSIVRSRNQRGILVNASWRRYRCRYSARSALFVGVLIVDEVGTVALRPSLIWRVTNGGLPEATQVDVADGPGRDVVLRVPGRESLFLARRETTFGVTSRLS